MSDAVFNFPSPTQCNFLATVDGDEFFDLMCMRWIDAETREQHCRIRYRDEMTGYKSVIDVSLSETKAKIDGIVAECQGHFGRSFEAFYFEGDVARERLIATVADLKKQVGRDPNQDAYESRVLYGRSPQ
jgi:hypothetical protein